MIKDRTGCLFSYCLCARLSGSFSFDSVLAGLLRAEALGLLTSVSKRLEGVLVDALFVKGLTAELLPVG